MKRYTHHIAFMLLFAVFTTLFIPAVPAQAFSLSDITGSSTQSSGGSSNLLNILLALLLGKVLGTSDTSNSNDISSTLGAAIIPKTAASTDTKATEIIKNAQKYMGVPYVWGGTTPAGWDCSGYTQYVMKESGITIPRTAAEQFNSGIAVNKNDLKIGDLVFFTTYKAGASHVGFYMGDGKFIHASSVAKQVTINSLSEDYYTEHYIGARRYIQK
ncbi:Gamma-DL-glutamyl hydrolase precursor [Sporomusa ovata DSM 2662]|uniref:NLP/P60 family protein n=1 Tax=Sporomusa ovata TaxID=2378 RepID=A0A0U1L182_9FIRM|nr:C40 family peptidase [Sporomusa ovata]EQB27247.1 gamma-DL-glutamyl hydrolase [Sporomusa ovata DSM 2662]CQR73089.1 NLP/P60 family protein [Sporomusa ovata]